MKTTRITIPIDNLRNGGALIVQRALTCIPGVAHVYVNPVIEMAYVTFDSSITDSDHLVAAIERTGLHAGVPRIR